VIVQDKKLIYNSDCIEQIQNLIEKGIQVDAVITDPPYNISKKNNFHTLKGRKGIDFGN
jgi:DNA modification methylase